MKNLVNIDFEEYEDKEYDRAVKFKAYVSEKRGESQWHTSVRKTRKKPRYKDKRLIVEDEKVIK